MEGLTSKRATRLVAMLGALAPALPLATAAAQEAGDTPEWPAGDEPEAVPEGMAADTPESAAGADTGATAGDAGFPVHGRVRLRSRSRWTPDDNDHDVYASTAIDFGDPERNGVTGHLDAYLAWDIDDSVEGPFFDLTDTYDGGVDTRLYEAYVDLHGASGFELLRFGRQQMWDTPVFVRFDGVALETAAWSDSEVSLGLYGGIPVHFFESSPSGDVVAGAYADTRPWTNGRLRLDFLHLEDDARLGYSRNDLWTLALWQTVQAGLNVHLESSVLDDELLDYRATANAFDPDGVWNFRCSWYQLTETKGLLANEIDPFYNALFELFPYGQLSLLGAYNVSERFVLQGNVDIRGLEEEDDVTEYNREYERYQLSGTLLDSLWEGVDITLIGDVWDGTETEIQTWGADVTAQLTERSEASIGSNFALYKYDFLAGEERDDVRTYYLRYVFDQSENLSVDVDYEFEDTDFENFQTLRLGLTWRF